MNSEEGYADVEGRHVHLPEGGRIRLSSPRFTRAMQQTGVIMEELREAPRDKFFRGDWNLAEQEWEAHDDIRLDKIEQVVEARRNIIRSGKGDGPRRSSKLLDSCSLLEISKSQIAKLLTSRCVACRSNCSGSCDRSLTAACCSALREKRKSFEASQSAMMQARMKATIDSADRKTAKADAYKVQMQRDFENWKQSQHDHTMRMQKRTAHEKALYVSFATVGFFPCALRWPFACRVRLTWSLQSQERKKDEEAHSLLEKARLAEENFDRLRNERDAQLAADGRRRAATEAKAQRRCSDLATQRRENATRTQQQHTNHLAGFRSQSAGLDGERQAKWEGLASKTEERMHTHRKEEVNRVIGLSRTRSTRCANTVKTSTRGHKLPVTAF